MTSMLSLLDARSLDLFTAAGHWREQTVYALVLQAEAIDPDKIAIREHTRSITYGQLVDAADRLAGEFERAGLRPGQRVAVWLPSRIETAVTLLACSRNDYVCSPSFHRAHTVAEVFELIERMRAAAVVAERGYGADADRRDIFDLVDQCEHVRVALPLEPRGAAAPDLVQSLVEHPPSSRPPHDDPNTIVYLGFTSGTTGDPKGVMHSDNTLLAPVRALASDWTLGREMVVCSMSPLSHNLGFGAMVLALTGGGELVIHDLPRAASLVDRLRATATTFLFGVPTHAIDLLDELDRNDHGLPALRGFRVSGAAMPAAVAQRLLDHGVVPQSGYGMTEAGSTHYTLPSDPATVIVGTSGRSCPCYEVRVFAQDDEDVELPIGQVGQIGGRGASLMLGYFDDQSRTERSFNASGWFMTGDLGVLDADGYLRIIGRQKDIIIRGGHNIYPARIEGLALGHAAIDKAAAIPLDDDRLGEKVCLVVSLRPGASLAGDQLLGYLDAVGLSKFDMPEYFAQVDDLPLLPSGKVSKRDLRGQIDQGHIVPQPVRYQPDPTR